MSKSFKTNRIFAVQAESFDGYYGPREKRSRWQKLVLAILIAPGVLIFLFPTHKIGVEVQRPPTFQVPDRVTKGSVFTIPVEPSIQAIMMDGRALPQIKSTQPKLLALAKSEPAMNLSLIYKGPERVWSANTLIPKTEHPTYEVFAKRIQVDPAPPQPEPPKRKGQPEPVKHEPDPTLLARSDGQAQAACWMEPKTTNIPMKPGADWRKLPTQTANLSSMAGGEVIRVEGFKNGLKNLVVYHGGGLFTRYLDLRETPFRKGDKMQPGQDVGVISLGNWKYPLKPRYDIYLNSTELNPQEFLALSSQLCDSK